MSQTANYFRNLFVFYSILRLCSSSSGWHGVGASTRYNVVMVIFDDLRPALGAYGDRLAQTPNLDKFLNGSFYFTRAYSQQALCAPSRNSLLTSRRPDTLHLYDFYSYWRTASGNFTTLPQYFKTQGYYTYSIGKIFHPGVSSNNSDDYPLSWSTSPFHPKSERYMNSPVCPDKLGMLKRNLICPVDLKTQPYKTLPDIESTNEAIRFLRTRPKTKRPYFLALGYHKPHINFRFPKEYLQRFKVDEFLNYTTDKYKPHDMPKVAWNPYTDIRKRDDIKHWHIPFPYGPIKKLQRAKIRQAYYAAVTYVDDLFGKFMAEVDLSSTIVLVTSDHGWSLGEHAEWAKYSNFEVALRVPLIIKSPEFSKGTTAIHECTELLDIFPTLVDLAHLAPIPKCRNDKSVAQQLTCTQGKSLYPLMKDGIGVSDKEIYALSQYPRPGKIPTQHPNSDKPKLKNIKIMGYSLRTEKFRYTLWVEFNPRNFTRDWSIVYGEELYDHRLNDLEEVNLAKWPQFNDIRMELQEKLIQAVTK
ncbi:iduronate 2-sulfatase [Musca domestica]|uniref:Iduronate 2-sulfatase n=1 Tax=Musca domestica TaxID=7370 RepID=A0ABM3UPR3_MUSDO|nr:iduronate 2-sulfatase [Musca domestica]